MWSAHVIGTSCMWLFAPLNNHTAASLRVMRCLCDNDHNDFKPHSDVKLQQNNPQVIGSYMTLVPGLLLRMIAITYLSPHVMSTVFIFGAHVP